MGRKCLLRNFKAMFKHIATEWLFNDRVMFKNIKGRPKYRRGIILDRDKYLDKTGNHKMALCVQDEISKLKYIVKAY